MQNLARLPEFGYTEVPPLYQEAAVIYAYGTKKPVPLQDFSPEVQRRIERFSSIFNRYGRNKEAAFGELAKDYAGSYFFYCIYAASVGAEMNRYSRYLLVLLVAAPVGVLICVLCLGASRSRGGGGRSGRRGPSAAYPPGLLRTP